MGIPQARKSASDGTRRRITPARIALAIAPILALSACDQISGWLGGTGSTPEVVAEADTGMPAVFGSILPEEARANLLAVQPVRVVPGEILVGAPLEAALAETASEMGLAANLISRLRSTGEDAFASVDPQQLSELVGTAEALAGDRARDRARVVLDRLGVAGEIDIRQGGVLTIDLMPEGADPTSLQFLAQQAVAVDQGDNMEEALLRGMEWEGGRCPRGVSDAQLDASLETRTLCTIARLTAARQFEFVEPNYIVEVGFDRLPNLSPQRPAPAPTPTTPTTTPTTQPTTGQPTTPSTPTTGGASTPTPAAPPAETQATGIDPDDPLVALQWHYRARGSAPGQSMGGAGFEPYWAQARQVGSRRVRVAVIDTGLDMRHPDIVGSPNVGRGIDLIGNPERSGDADGVDANANDDGDRCGSRTTDSFHGTHVAGTIGAVTTNDHRGVAGGAWNVTVLPVRTLGRCGGELEDIVNGIRWAAGLGPAITASGQELRNDTPADIINMSLSMGVTCPPPMQAAIDAAVARGSVIVVAAGNKSNPTRLFAPANCNNVMVVAAGDARGALAFYSNFGPEVDVMAPGGDMFTDSDNDGRPDGVLSTRRAGQDCYDPETQEGKPECFYGYEQGTSMAAPHVAAALALLQSQSGTRGRELETLFFSRAVARYQGRAAVCEIDCARNPNATPIPGQAGRCMRDCGQGVLDLGLAAAAR
ncbi:MAG: S8 family serine peptidase [Caulobacterales bacterium]